MGTVGVKFKIMPKDININLSELKGKIKKNIESFESGVFNDSEEKSIAFGLKALQITFAISENQEIDEVENSIKEIEEVSSVELIDYRRAVG